MQNCFRLNKLLGLLLIALIPTCGFSQNRIIVLSGKTKINKGSKIFLYQNYENPIFSKTIDSTIIDTNGNFKFKLLSNHLGFYQIHDALGFSYTESDIILLPDDSLFISSNTDTAELKSTSSYHFKSTFFSGKGASLNNYLVNYYCNLSPITIKFDSLFQLSPEVFCNYINRWKQGELARLRGYIEINRPSEQVKKILFEKINLRNANYHFLYWKVHGNTDHRKPDTKIDDSTFFSFLTDINLPDTENMSSYDYQTFLSYYAAYKVNQDSLCKFESANEYMANFEVIKKYFSGVQQDYAIYQLTKDFLYWSNKYYADFATQVAIIQSYLYDNQTNPLFLEKFITKANECLANTPDGKMKNFSYPDSTGKLNSLSNYADKIVYIKLWALWCAPCLKSMPDYNNLVVKFDHDTTGIVFINICIDSENNKEKWLSQIKKSNIKGLSVFCNENFTSKYQRPSSFPSYILLNKENRIKHLQAKSPLSVEKDIQELLNSTK